MTTPNGRPISSSRACICAALAHRRQQTGVVSGNRVKARMLVAGRVGELQQDLH